MATFSMLRQRLLKLMEVIYLHNKTTSLQLESAYNAVTINQLKQLLNRVIGKNNPRYRKVLTALCMLPIATACGDATNFATQTPTVSKDVTLPVVTTPAPMPTATPMPTYRQQQQVQQREDNVTK